jgi:CDP-glycerol glycerophosphotransferase
MSALRGFMRSSQVLAGRVVTAAGKRLPILLTAARGGVDAFRRARYRRVCRRTPVEPGLVIFEGFSGRTFSDSPRALYRELLRDRGGSGGPAPVWVLRAPLARALAERGYAVRGLEDFPGASGRDLDLDARFGAEALEELRHATIVARDSREYRRSYARAALWVSNSILPTYLEPRQGQAYLQTWHGTPLKRLGRDIETRISGNAMYSSRDVYRRYVAEGRRFTWLVSPSAYATEKLGSAFDLLATGQAGKIIEEGYPRNDVLSTFTARDAARARERFGIPEGKKVVLYAPTFRDDQHSSKLGYIYESQADFAALRAALGDDFVVLFRAHYLVANAFDFASQEGFVLDVSAIDDINDLYEVSDLLVTDYSSVFFDYANLLRPVVFFMYDLEQYAGELRGFYLGLDELPGPITRTTADLIEAIRGAGGPDEDAAARRERFRDRFCGLDDGHASERVLARVLAAPGATAGVAEM